MWWKLVLLTIYLAVLFILSRILEAVAYYEAGYLTSRLLDPVSLSVKKLKILLDQRGVSYAGVVEKQELTELVESSGEATESELEAASLSSESSSSTNFTCGTHFYEEVEDCKDSVWVVQVTRHAEHAFMRQDDWKAFVKKVSRFGVRTGIFDCSLDWRLCDRKQWFSSRLIMALPQGHRVKDNVVLRSYTGSTKIQAVLDWVNFNLASRIQVIQSLDTMQNDWYHYNPKNIHESKVRVVLFSKLKIPPMFYSALSVKFSGRAKFGTVKLDSPAGSKMVEELNLSHVPTYLVIVPEGNFTFGHRDGEYLSYYSMGLLLRSLHPEVNDIFLLSLIVVNLMCWLDLFITRGSVLKRLGNLLWSIGKWNCFLILLWLPIIGLFQLPYMDLVLSYGLTFLRLIGHSQPMSWFRADWLQYTSIHSGFLICTFLLFSTLVGVLYYIYRDQEQESRMPINNNSDWWNLNWDVYVNSLLTPVASLTRPMSPTDMDLEVGMEMLIERLAVPNFWLQSLISSDYIKELPVWRYVGPTVDSDVCSDSECSLKLDSEGEDPGSGSESPTCGTSADVSQRPPYLFICEKCRALQEQNNPHPSPEMDAESESACAEFLMDGDYKCMCKLSPRSHGHGRHGHGRSSDGEGRHQSHGPTKHRSRSSRGMSRSSSYLVEKSDDDMPNQSPPGMIHSTECVICLDSYKYDVILCGLPCGHSFHQQCIMGWLSRDNHCCPVCRWPTYKAKPCQKHSHSE